MRAAILSFLLGAAAVPAFALDFASTDTEAEAVVAAAFAETLADSRAAGAQDAIFTARADLNGDGAPEILGMAQSGYICSGAGGCPIGVFEAKDGGFHLVATVYGDVLDVLESQSNGWRDLGLGALNGVTTWKWTGSEYSPQ